MPKAKTDDTSTAFTAVDLFCGADVTPTVEQVSRWHVYEFEEEIDVKGNPE